MCSTRTWALERWNTAPDVTRACSQVRKTADKTRSHLSTSSPSSEGASLMQGLWPIRYINLACRPAFGEVCSAGSSTGAAIELWGERDLLGARCCSLCGQDVLGSARRELSLVAEVPFVTCFCLQTISSPVCVITRFLGVIFGSYSHKIKPWPQISVGVSLAFPPLYLYYCSTPRKKRQKVLSWSTAYLWGSPSLLSIFIWLFLSSFWQSAGAFQQCLVCHAGHTDFGGCHCRPARRVWRVGNYSLTAAPSQERGSLVRGAPGLSSSSVGKDFTAATFWHPTRNENGRQFGARGVTFPLSENSHCWFLATSFRLYTKGICTNLWICKTLTGFPNCHECFGGSCALHPVSEAPSLAQNNAAGVVSSSRGVWERLAHVGHFRDGAGEGRWLVKPRETPSSGSPIPWCSACT